MEPRKLLQALMTRAGDNSNSLAVKLKLAVKQPQIYKFLHGQVAEPKRSNIEPIAQHYGVPVEAFYDHDIAQREYERLMSAGPAEYQPPKAEAKPPAQGFWVEKEPAPLDQATKALLIDSMVENELYMYIGPSYEVVRDYDRRSDLTITDHHGRKVLDVEVRTLGLRGTRPNQMPLDALIGRLWKRSRAHRDDLTPRALVVVLLIDGMSLDVDASLIRDLATCVTGELISSFTVLGLVDDGSYKSFTHIQSPYNRPWPKDIQQMLKASMQAPT